MKIDPKTLELLHKYLQDDGDASTEGFKTFLGTTSDNVVKAYQDALVEAYPDEYGDDSEEDEDGKSNDPVDTVPAQVAEASACDADNSCCDLDKCCKEKRILLLDEDTNITSELEVKSESEKSLVLVQKTPKDEVAIRVAGEDLVVDLIKLRKMDSAATLGTHKVSTLILAAELAKA